MSYLEVVADMTNDILERNREVLSQAHSDLLLYGRAEYQLVL